MQIDVSHLPSWTLLTLAGRVDHAGSDALKSALAPHLTGGAVALDFAAVEYVTSSGFRVLLQALKEQQAKGGRLLLGNMSEPLRGFFEMAGLSTVFKIVHDVHSVIQAPA